MRLHGYQAPLVAAAGPDVSTLGMVAVYPLPEEAEALAVEGGLEPADLHCTLVFLGEADDLPDTDVMTAALETVAMELAPIEGTVGGIGHFAEGPDGVPVIALPDVPGLTLLRERVVDELGHSGVRSPSEHGFLPHLTLEYADPGTTLDLEVSEEKLGRPLTFGAVSLVVAGERYDYELAGARVAAAEPPAGPAPATPDEIAAATARASERLQADENVDPLAAAYREVLERAAGRMSRALTAKATVLAAAGDPTEPPKRFVPPNADEVIDVAAIAADVADVLGKAQRDAARVVVAELDEEGISYDVDTVFTDELLDRIGEVAATSIEAEMRDQYRATIEEAAEQGFSVVDAAEALSDKIDDLAPHTARAMARTDLNGLANGGSLHVAQQSLSAQEEPVYKTWLATPDERTRDTHEEADGQTVPLNENFRVGLSSLPYPGYPFAPAEEVINCRCTITYTSDPTGRQQVVTDPEPEVGLPPMLSLPTTALARALPTAELEALRGGKVPAMHLDVFAPALTPEQHELVTALAMRATDLSALAASLQALAVAVATPAPAPVVHVHVPEQPAAAPVVHVQVPEQHAPVVHLAEGPAPVVNVEVTVPPAEPVIHVEVPEPAPRRIEFDRDGMGRIEAAEEVPA